MNTMSSQYKIIHPVKYLQDHLAQDIRPDGRQFLNFRPMSINVSPITQADSSAIFKIGNSTVVCGIKLELAAPKVETPECGYVIPNVELSPLCSSKFRPGAPSEEAQIASKMVDSILNNSSVIKLTDLCICKGKLAWVLYCDLLCINYDGSIIDACIGALLGALKTLNKPRVSYNQETGSITVEPNNRTPLPVYTLPVSSSFVIFDNQLLIVDPTEEEESLSLGKLSIVISDEQISCVHKPGGIPVSEDLLLIAIGKAKEKTKLVQSLINTAVLSMEKSNYNMDE